MIYVDKQKTFVRVLQTPKFGNQEIVVFEYVEDDDEAHALTKATFDATYSPYWPNCGVDVYSILHEVLDKRTAYEYARKIELAFEQATKKNK